MLVAIALALVSLIAAVSWWLLKEFTIRSPLDNVPGPRSPSLLSGHLEDLFHRHKGWQLHNELSNSYAGVSRIRGFLGKRVLYVFDHAALQSIILKDQQYYEESSFFLSINLLLFGPGLGSTLHEQHRKQRKMLNPVFSINHMRNMSPIFYRVTHKLRDGIQKQVVGAPGDVDMLNWMSRTALELVGQGGLGYSFDPLVEDSKNKLGDAIKVIIPALWALGGLVLLTPYALKLGSAPFRRRLLDLLPSKKVQFVKGLTDVMDAHSKDIISRKRLALSKGDEAVLQQVGEGKDIISILMRANTEVVENERLSEEELLAQMTSLIFAATDTTSGALAQILQLLAQHPDIQDKLRTEIIQANRGQDIPYDELIELPYLDAVCRETLRLYPPVSEVYRDCRKDMVLPLSEPIRGVDGTWMKEVPIPKDTRIVISIRGCNRNKATWGEDALEWKPERWLSPLPDSVTNARIPGVYSNMMTFLGGGRSCIGFKFSQLEMKIVLSVLLKSFRFSPSDKEIVWNLSLVKYPTVGRESDRPSMPMKVDLLKA